MLYALRVLDGTAAFKGTSEQDFHLELYEEGDPEYKADVKGLAAWNRELMEKLERLELKKREAEEKYCFLAGALDLPPYRMAELNREWEAEGHKEPLFTGTPDVSGYASTMLDEYIEQQTSGREDDYGWLSPEGIFYPSEWGEHGGWAKDWLESHCPDWEERYRKFPDCPKYPVPEDFMKQILHWTLIHSPSQGLPRHTLYPGQALTKKQKEFLTGFYEKRRMREDAKLLEQED